MNHLVKINNSYESNEDGSSNSISSAGEQFLDKSENYGEMDSVAMLASLIVPSNFSSTASKPISAIPSYIPNEEYYDVKYDCHSPHLYSFPIYHNEPKLYCNYPDYQPEIFIDPPKAADFGSSLTRVDSFESNVLSNQNAKYHDFLELCQKNELVINAQDDSCNAVDHNLREIGTITLPGTSLSFNGKINDLLLEDEATREREAQDLLDEERSQRDESFEILKKEDSSLLQDLNETSPELFNASDLAEYDQSQRYQETVDEEVKVVEDDDVFECDRKILKRMTSSLTGICPPPSITRIQIGIDEMLRRYHENKNEILELQATDIKSLFKPTVHPEVVDQVKWPEIKLVKCHDITYNRSQNTENIERLRLRFSDRFIGLETSSSFINALSPSSAKKRSERLKIVQQAIVGSPGRRLSHLARRRTIFSSENLKSNSLNSQLTNAAKSNRQILIDKSKLSIYQKSSKAKSPRKKTPGRKTPKSAKRRNQENLLMQPTTSTVCTRETSKRALFTSPLEKINPIGTKLTAVNIEIASRVQRSKRALFSPFANDDSKRRRTDSPDNEFSTINYGQTRRPQESPNKFQKSSSFGGLAETSAATSLRNRMFNRTQSEILPVQKPASQKHSFTKEIQKKSLWAISNSLGSKQITQSHPKFKEYVRILLKLIKKIFEEFYNPSARSVSDQLLKIANSMVFYVIQGKTFDEIYNQTKDRLLKKGATKIIGYIAPNEYEKQKCYLFRSNNSLMLQSQSTQAQSSSQFSEYSFDSGTVPSMKKVRNSETGNGPTTRSTSKSNESSALRENFRGSREKTAVSTSKLFVGSKSNLLKAKRQISF